MSNESLNWIDIIIHIFEGVSILAISYILINRQIYIKKLKDEIDSDLHQASNY